MHSLLIALHAGTGVIAMLTGGVALFRGGRLFRTYLGSLAATTLFLALAVAGEWSVLDVGSRGLFTAFTVLAVVMVVRGVLARRLPPRSPAYLEHVGFTLIALCDAFAVIAVLNAGAPVWLVVASGVLIAVGGHFALRATKRVLADDVRARDANDVRARDADGGRARDEGPLRHAQREEGPLHRAAGGWS